MSGCLSEAKDRFWRKSELCWARPKHFETSLDIGGDAPAFRMR
jgi:hypothetical protein